ncbi:AMP-dependent synthetase/ligase [Kribbia dieselivorans]|uniref:AMP-dependent synthetase/ligase n=1 Tax=Kribbia dieselivorans TaxID=331526 RepID=UPI000837B1B0|nr:AMP-dependent synthetase/ligase [Kribbia dieselivorans]
MQESITPQLFFGDPEDSLADIPFDNAKRNPSHVAISKRAGDGWSDVSAAQLAGEVQALAKGLVAKGLQPGQIVAIMAPTCYEWTLFDLAIWTAGGISVPVYESSSPAQINWMFTDSGVRFAVAHGEKHATAIEQGREGSRLEQVWRIDQDCVTELVAAGTDVPDSEVDDRRAALNRASLATIIYTSGTTGRPKGCEITHDNLLSVAEQAIARVGDEVLSGEDSSTLLFLPLAHVFARAVEIIALKAEVRLGHSADIANLLPDFATFKPTFILAVPRVFEKIYNKASETTEAEGKGKIFQAAADTAIAWSKAVDSGSVPLWLKVKHWVFDKLVYSKLRARMGGRVRYAISGGAPLGARLGHFFRGLGVTILEGYGLTETTAPVGVVVPDNLRIGTVGPPLPGVGARIADDGEVLVKGLVVFRGYYNNPEATKAAFTPDGWFHTGDLGAIDDEGNLSITGRKKEIIVTAGGKNVAPAVLEDQLRLHPLISQIVVVGDQKPFIGAILTLDPEMYPGWAKNHGIEAVSFGEAKHNPVVLAEIQRAVDEANKAVSKAESIRKFHILDSELTEESGHLTPSLKIKRNVVLKDHATDIEALYS